MRSSPTPGHGFGGYGARLPRDLHPVAWWVWALGLAAAATRTANPWLLLLIVGVASVTVVARRGDAPWALSFRLYLALGALVVAVRVVFRILFGGGYGERVLLDLPAVPLPDWTSGITLLGPVTLDSVLAGAYDGLRLATIIICVGAANSLADPRKLLAIMPPALYEVGTAVVIAFSLFPQLAESVQRVRRARRLRGDAAKGVAALRRVVVPVLEDALDRSVALAASMDARGYGRTGTQARSARLITGTCLVLGLLGLLVGSYAYLDVTAPRVLAWPMLVAGVALATAGFVGAGRGVARTRYRPPSWTPSDIATALTGLVAAALMTLAARDLAVVLPDPAALPPLSALALSAALVGVLPAFFTPPPKLTSDEQPRHELVGETDGGGSRARVA
jgi:energy-coupling factor transport system permease protein